MGTIVFCGISPHPPIMVPEVGKDQVANCIKSRKGLQTFSNELAASKPDIIVIITPHGQAFSDVLTICSSTNFHGNFAPFGAPEVQIEIPGHPTLANRIAVTAAEQGIPILNANETNYARFGIPPDLDHATLVPLYYFREANVKAPLVLIRIGFLPYPELFEFGKLLRKACEVEGKRIAIVASGDLSHRLIPTAPAGFDPIGKEFDAQMVEYLSKPDSHAILNMSPALIERAGECGFRPIVILLGALDGLHPKAEIISYEGPFGVGYGVVSYSFQGENSNA